MSQERKTIANRAFRGVCPRMSSVTTVVKRRRVRSTQVGVLWYNLPQER